MTVFSLLSLKKKKQALCVSKPLHVSYRQREVGFDLQYKRIEKKNNTLLRN